MHLAVDKCFTALICFNYMPWKTGAWGEQEKERSKRRREYFRVYHLKGKPLRVPTGCSVDIGRLGEVVGARVFPGANKRGYASHWDLEWKGKKVEVKTSVLGLHGNAQPRWFFFVGSQVGKVDCFLFVCLDEQQVVRRLYLLPGDLIRTRNISITERSNRWPEYPIWQK